MDAVSRSSYRYRKGITVLFILFFIAVFVLKGSTGIAFTLIEPNDIDPVFPRENQIVVLYENADEDHIAGIIPAIEEEPCVSSVMAWPNTLGKAFTAEELGAMCARAVWDLMRKLEVPSLKASGFTREQALKAAEEGYASHLSTYCPVPVTREGAERMAARMYDA